MPPSLLLMSSRPTTRREETKRLGESRVRAAAEEPSAAPCTAGRRQRTSRKRAPATTQASLSARAHFRPRSRPASAGSAPRLARGPRSRVLLLQLPSVVPENRSDFTRFSVLADHKKDDCIPLRVRAVWRLETNGRCMLFSFSQGAIGTPSRAPPHGPLAPARCIVGVVVRRWRPPCGAGEPAGEKGSFPASPLQGFCYRGWTLQR